jgi:hypothetical protein
MKDMNAAIRYKMALDILQQTNGLLHRSGGVAAQEIDCLGQFWPHRLEITKASASIASKALPYLAAPQPASFRPMERRMFMAGHRLVKAD